MQKTLTRRTMLALTGAAMALSAPIVMAHTGADLLPHGHETDAWQALQDGLRHPFTGLDHLAAMVSVGCWSALRLPASASRSLRDLLVAPAAFAGMLLAGALIGMTGASLPGIEPMIAASLLVLGLLVATRMKLGAAVGGAIVGLFAVFHGVAHGAELQGHAAALAGMLLSTLTLHAAGLMAGLALQRAAEHPASRWGSRLAGGSVALFGAGLLAPALNAAI